MKRFSALLISAAIGAFALPSAAGAQNAHL